MKFVPSLLRLATIFAGLHAALPAAAVRPASLFTDHAVLQCDRPVPVWGEAAPGEEVIVRYLGQEVRATAGADGRWQASLAPMPAGRAGELVLATAHETLMLKDVVTGEVWLASGQSNMSLNVSSAADAAREIAGSANPMIREFRAAVSPAAAPQAFVKGAWEQAGPESVGKFSAAAYYFARAVQRELGVPVGIINSSKGGTPIEAWMSARALASDPAFAVVPQRWTEQVATFPEKNRAFEQGPLAHWEEEAAKARAAGRSVPSRPTPPPGAPGDFREPSVLFNGMIRPLLPYAIRGALWYQGEANAAKADEYPALGRAMLAEWRRGWGEGDFPFLVVQLPNFELPGKPDATGGIWARMRAAQAAWVASESNAALAVTYDIGDPGNVHPANKQEVGRRLALVALARVYGRTVVSSGPELSAAVPDGANARLTFTGSSPLTVAGGGEPGGFELSADGVSFVPARAVLAGSTVTLSAAGLERPRFARYAWRNNPTDATLRNAAELPAAPFQVELTGERPDPLWAQQNLLAWCIVPFDARKRGPEERADMLARLGFREFAYDWRDEHLGTFDAEIDALRRRNIKLVAWWFPGQLNPQAETILAAIARAGIHPQLWVSGGGRPVTSPAEQLARIESEAARIRPIVERAAALGCTVALYNHGGWFGEPDNELAVLARLRADGFNDVRLVFNFHHAHEHIDDFAAVWPRIAPYVDTVNLNGMHPGEKSPIAFLGEPGGRELEMMRIIRDSGWRGRIGLINHRTNLDAEEGLRRNQEGLARLARELREVPAK